METLSPVRRKNKTPSRTGFPSSRVSAAAWARTCGAYSEARAASVSAVT